MTTSTGLGFSQHADTLIAAQEAAHQAKRRLDHERIDLAFLFHSVHYDPEKFIPVIYETLDQTRIIGSSTAGIIMPDRVESRGIGILAINSEDIRFESGYSSHVNLRGAHQAGIILAKNSITDFGQQHRRLFIFFSDGLIKGVSDLMEGIKEQLGEEFLILGAGSSDNFQFYKTYQLYHNNAMTKSAVGVLLGGRLNIAMSCKHGWKPLGRPRTIHETEGHIIKSIDGKKAISIYEEYFDEEAETLKKGKLGHLNICYPLGLRMGKKHEYLLRNVIGTQDDGSLVCQEIIPPHTEVHIMIGNKDFCLQGAEDAALEVKDQLQGRPPKLILILESQARYKLLGRAAFQEIQIIKNILGTSAPIMGMYSCNEIYNFCSLLNSAPAQLQNGSILILAIN